MSDTTLEPDFRVIRTTWGSPDITTEGPAQSPWGLTSGLLCIHFPSSSGATPEESDLLRLMKNLEQLTSDTRPYTRALGLEDGWLLDARLTEAACRVFGIGIPPALGRVRLTHLRGQVHNGLRSPFMLTWDTNRDTLSPDSAVSRCHD
jgi:hypothetical protein